MCKSYPYAAKNNPCAKVSLRKSDPLCKSFPSCIHLTPICSPRGSKVVLLVSIKGVRSLFFSKCFKRLNLKALLNLPDSLSLT